MILVFNEVFSDIANRFETWLQSNNAGRLVANNRKDYINRAQRWLQLEKPWEGLVVDSSITISNGVASLPPEFISLIALGHSILDTPVSLRSLKLLKVWHIYI